MDFTQLVGQTLDHRYEIETLLGRGEFGVVYKARDVELKKPATIKILLHNIGNIYEYQNSKEAHVAKNIKHPNIVPIYDWNTTKEGLIYTVWEYFEGHNLREEINKKGRFSPKEALEIITPIANALSQIHKMGVIHRDIKPENILISNDITQVKIIDFGISTLKKPNELINEAEIWRRCYMSPEQLLPTKYLDQSTDIYSLAVIMYEMVTGKQPFVGLTTQEVLEKQISFKVITAKELNPDIPETFSLTIKKALAEKSYERPRSCQELVEQLQASLEAQSSNKTIVIENTGDIKKDNLVSPLVISATTLSVLTTGALAIWFLGSYGWLTSFLLIIISTSFIRQQTANKFRKKIEKLLTEPIPYNQRETLYLSVESIETKKLYLSAKVRTFFKVTKHPAVNIDSTESAKQKNIIKPILSGEIIGEQILYYTFSNTQPLEKHKKDFVEFVKAEYVSPEQLKEETEQYWKRVLNNSESKS